MDTPEKGIHLMRNLKLTSFIGILVLADQCIKLYIKNNLFHARINLLGDFVQLEPMINTKYSWVNSMLDLGINKAFHIIMVILAIFIIFVVFKFVTTMYLNNKIINSLFILLISGAICSLSDKLFWGGSLDYIKLKGLFTFDLKDVYVSAFEVLIVCLLIINYKSLKEISNRKLLSDFRLFLSGNRRG